MGALLVEHRPPGRQLALQLGDRGPVAQPDALQLHRQDGALGDCVAGRATDGGEGLLDVPGSGQKGETGLVEVLNAQRSYAELRMNHIEALFDYTVALINLEKASGIWDLNQ